MGTLWQDIRHGLRVLRKEPGFTAIALVTLAIGIGANTIMFSMVNMMLLRPVQVKEPEQLVSFDAQNTLFSYEVYREVREEFPPFSNITAFGRNLVDVTLVRGNVARKVSCAFVAANYFSFLGMAPARGQTFQPAEEQQGAEPVAVLSYRLWRQQGSDPDAVGSQITIDGTIFRVIGIAAKGFTGTTLIGPELWLPLGTYGLVGNEFRIQSRRRAPNAWSYPPLLLIGRLKPGLDRTTAETQLQAVLPHLQEQYRLPWRKGDTVRLQGLSRVLAEVGPEDRLTLRIVSAFLMAVSIIILAIACMNLGNMIVIQGTRRHREIAIRMAIGGNRLRIVRQLLSESLLLALAGGAFGCLLAVWGMKVVSVWLTQAPELRTAPEIGLDWRVLAGTLGFCLAATVLSGLRPALRLSRRDVVADMKESGGQSTSGRCKKRSLISGGFSVAGQIALSVVLVMGATLFTRSAFYAAGVKPGFSLEGKVVVEIDPLAAGYDQARSLQAYERLTDRFKSIPGVQAAAFSASFPICGEGGRGNAIVEYEPGTEIEEKDLPMRREPAYLEYHVGEGFFEAMDIPLMQGRSFNHLDAAADAERVAIVDEHLARRLRPDGNALGCFVQFGFLSLSSPCRIIGIVPGVRGNARDELNVPQIYLPAQSDELPKYIHLRQAGGVPETILLDEITRAIHEVDPHLPVVAVTTLRQRYHSSFSVWIAGLGAKLAVTFGAMALFLASLGIYAIKGYMVASRTPEIGIRVALGATSGNIMGMVLREGLLLTLVGLISGLVLGLGIARVIASAFYGIPPTDGVSIVVTIALLGAASLLAGFIPARRAAKIDPMEALRYE